MNPLLSSTPLWSCMLLVCLAPSANATIVLYDASGNELPTAQGWTYLTDPLFSSEAIATATQQTLTLDTTPDRSELAGYFSKTPISEHPQNPTMDFGVSSYSIEFTMRQVSGSDVADDDPLALNERNRGGFSVIALGDDLRGVELQFQTDHVLALSNINAAFPIGESSSFDTTDSFHAYELQLSNTDYQLSIDSNLILQGPLRDYSGVGPAFPYATSNFLFFGDDTGRGAAATQLKNFQVTAIPEPSPFLLVMAAFGICGFFRRGSANTEP